MAEAATGAKAAGKAPARLPAWYQERRKTCSKAQKKVLATVWPKYGRSEQQRTLKYGEAVDLDAWFTEPTHEGAPADEQGRTERWIDIGFGTGDSLLELAAARPHDQFLGVEIYRTGHALVAAACEERKLRNIRLIGGDTVKFLARQCPAASLDVANVFFPDPLMGQARSMRLLDAAFLELLDPKMRGDCPRLHFACDVSDYVLDVLKMMDGVGRGFGWHLVALARSGAGTASGTRGGPSEAQAADQVDELLGDKWPRVSLSLARPDWRPQTHFERVALEEGRFVWDATFERASRPAKRARRDVSPGTPGQASGEADDNHKEQR